MSNISINKKIIIEKNFLSQSQINKIVLEIHNLMLTKNKKKKIKKTNLKDLNIFYNKIKKKKIWKDIYDDFFRLKTIKNIIEPKIINKTKKILKARKVRILTKGLRIIEKSSKRKYPIHQEYPGIESKSFLVFWIALHNIKLFHGGLLISKNIVNKKLPHIKDTRKYDILKNQIFWKKTTYEKTFDSGELLILGKYVQHGTASKIYGQPRWACIVRAGI